ncbi:DUF6207 family protein [Streptomyces sp. NPDC003236]
METGEHDDSTARAAREFLTKRWATATMNSTIRHPGQPGVRPRCYFDLHQEPNP